MCGTLMLLANSKPSVVRILSNGVKRLLDMKYPLSHTQACTCDDPEGDVECGGQSTHVV